MRMHTYNFVLTRFLTLFLVFVVQMVWEQGSVVIVMLTKLTENGVAMCHRYWPEEGSDLYHIYEVTFKERLTFNCFGQLVIKVFCLLLIGLLISGIILPDIRGMQDPILDLSKEFMEFHGAGLI